MTFKTHLAATAAALALVATALGAATVDASAARAASPRSTDVPREVHDRFVFRASWQQLEAGVLRSGPADSVAFAGPSAFFRPVMTVLDVRDADTALDSTGEEGPCTWGYTPTTCSRIRIKATFSLADLRWLDRLRSDAVTWCAAVYSTSGQINSLYQEDCGTSYVSVYWPKANGVTLGWMPFVEVEGVTWARQDFIMEKTVGIEIKLAAVPTTSLACKPVPQVVPGLAPGMSVYDAARVLSPKDARWDQLLRRVERQRTALRRHARELEDAAYDAALIYALLPVDVALQLVGGSFWKNAGFAFRQGKKAVQLVRSPGCRRLTPAQLERQIVRSLDRLRRIEQRQQELLRELAEAEAKGQTGKVKVIIEELMRLLRQR